MLFLRSLLFFVVMVLSTLMVTLPALLTFPFSFLARYRVISQWARFNLWCLQSICNLRYEVEGAENIPNGAAIVFAKHQSTWETLALQCILPPQTWVLKRELLKVPFFGWSLAMLEPVAIDRAAGRVALQQLIEQGKDRLNKGRYIIVFPEGTRIAPGMRRRFAFGGAKLAEKSGFPVLPVAHNAGYFWPRHGFIKRPGVIKVKIGPVIESKNDAGRIKAAVINEAAEQWIAQAMTEITGEVEEVVERKSNGGS
jgi:1-acyl-sn-glycerol-3-phosphate acyltransferase